MLFVLAISTADIELITVFYIQYAPVGSRFHCCSSWNEQCNYLYAPCGGSAARINSLSALRSRQRYNYGLQLWRRYMYKQYLVALWFEPDTLILVVSTEQRICGIAAAKGNQILGLIRQNIVYKGK